jgi:hypothetical protein
MGYKGIWYHMRFMGECSESWGKNHSDGQHEFRVFFFFCGDDTVTVDQWTIPE